MSEYTLRTGQETLRKILRGKAGRDQRLSKLSGISLAKTGERLSGKQPDRPDADFIQDDQGHGHEQLIHHIRGRSQNSGDDKGQEDGIPSMPVQKRDTDQAHLGQQHHEYRQFKNDAKGDQQPQAQGEIFLYRRQRAQEISSVAEQETEGGRKNDKITKAGPAQETQGGEKYKGNKNPFFMPVQTRGDKLPDLPENDRRGQEDAAD